MKKKTEKNLKLDMRTRTQEMIFYHFHKTFTFTHKNIFLQEQVNKKKTSGQFQNNTIGPESKPKLIKVESTN